MKCGTCGYEVEQGAETCPGCGYVPAESSSPPAEVAPTVPAESESMTRRIYGIDLGTTYSCISYVDEHGRPSVIANSDGDLTTPSVVYFESADNIVVGKIAKNANKVEPDRVAELVKRYMGDETYDFRVDGKTYKPETISALILRRLVDDAATIVGEPITDVVITCPAYFGFAQREATKMAGEIAGLKVHNILSEPTAAAICYGYGAESSGKGEVVLVYDLGGGTFDVTMISVREEALEVVYTDGNHNLGGRNWDQELVDLMTEKFLQLKPDADDPTDDPQALQELFIAAEDAKKALTNRERYPFHFQRARIEITREEFERKTEALLNQTLDITRRVVNESAKRGYEQVDKILLVGGSSKMPMVAKALERNFGLETKMYDPDQAVAKGAACFGMKEQLRWRVRRITGDDPDTVPHDQLEKAVAQIVSDVGGGELPRLSKQELLKVAKQQVKNVASKSVGLVVVDRSHESGLQVSFLIRSNATTLPASGKSTFFTAENNQDGAHIRVMEQSGQAESPRVEHNTPLVDDELPLPPNLPQNSPIEISFSLTDDGRLEITALDPNSKNVIHMEAKITGVMSSQEVEQARKDIKLLSVTGG